MKKILLLLIIILLPLIIYFIFYRKENYKNEYQKYSNYKKENLFRYKQYKLNNKTVNIKQIILNVNIGLDKPFYTNVKRANNLNTYYILVNKYNYLENDYIPNNLVNINSKIKLVKEASDSFAELVKNARKENKKIVPISGYRNYNYQKDLYNRYYKIDGSKADTYSARAGYSEHQTGLAIDVSNSKKSYTDFESTEEFVWMNNNAYKYGFILRYPKNKENITGYSYESWHYRYVGIKIATYIYKNNITFDEYYYTFIE